MKRFTNETGQGMVEYIVVLVFAVMLLTVGPGGDILLDLLAVLNDNHQGYSYAASLSDLPEHDNLAEYALEVTALEQQFTDLANFSFDDLFTDIPGIPSEADIIAEGVRSVTGF